MDYLGGSSVITCPLKSREFSPAQVRDAAEEAVREPRSRGLRYAATGFGEERASVGQPGGIEFCQQSEQTLRWVPPKLTWRRPDFGRET